MAYIRFNEDLNNMTTHLRAMQSNMRQEAAQIVKETIEDGANLMRQNIETKDRIDQGYMLGDVAASEVQSDAQGVRGQFGWGVTGGPVQPYYLYQENGFRHWRSGKDVPPMHALLESFITVREQFFAKVVRMVRG